MSDNVAVALAEFDGIVKDSLSDSNSNRREIEQEVLAWFAAAYKRGPEVRPEHIGSLVLFLAGGSQPSYLVTNDKLSWSSQREAGAFADALDNLRTQLPDRIEIHLQAADRKDSSPKVSAAHAKLAGDLQRLSEASAIVGKVYQKPVLRVGTPHDWREVAIHLARLISRTLKHADAAAAAKGGGQTACQEFGPAEGDAGGAEGSEEDDAMGPKEAAAEPEDYVKFTAPSGPAVRVLQKALAFVEGRPPRKPTALVEPFRGRNLVGR